MIVPGGARMGQLLKKIRDPPFGIRRGGGEGVKVDILKNWKRSRKKVVQDKKFIFIFCN
jgi:hypothetical protein